MNTEKAKDRFATMMRAILACGSLAFAACGAPPSEEAGSGADAVTDVHATPVKEQVIGNCWLYSITGWTESLHKAATGEELNLSESYLTYWYWFGQLTKPGKCGVAVIEEGGSWDLARGLVERYGMMREGDFIPEDASSGASTRQAAALKELNEALASESSAMQKAVAAGDRRAIRKELDRIWKLPSSVQADLDAVFGPDGSRTLDRKDAAVPATGSKVIPARTLTVRIPAPSSRGDAPREIGTRTLADAVSGAHVWTEVAPPAWHGDETPEARRSFERRIQRALHDGLPVLVSWWVDVESMDSRGNFRPRTSAASGEGGGHMSMITDYEVTNVPGFGTLKAGEMETRQAALDAALDENAKISFFRIKNSWGYWPSTWKERLGRLLGGVDLGYNDLQEGYLFDFLRVAVDPSMLTAGAPPGQAAPCMPSATAKPNVKINVEILPLLGVVLPPGY